MKSIAIRAIVELPTVAFAQAGTRTKTSILYIQKTSNVEQENIFVAKSESLGFEVSTRKGATIKYELGTNDLPLIVEAYVGAKSVAQKKQYVVLMEKPSAMLIDQSLLDPKSWTPGHFSSERFKAIDGLKRSKAQIDLVKLSEIVRFEGKERKRGQVAPGSRCISVLHVFNNDHLNMDELWTYEPKYSGLPCNPGDLLISKINPRIPRMIVVPNLGVPTSCSSEFEIVNSSIDLNNHGIKLLLMLPSVQSQIIHLTSGTSSSHNRIKTADLASVVVPLPRKSTKAYVELVRLSEQYEALSEKVTKDEGEMNALRKRVPELLIQQ